jgi:hypothetical protein
MGGGNMKGHQALIQLRKTGLTPKIVFINDYHCKTDWIEYRDHATLCTAGDSLSSLDLRCINGLAVSISASTESRAKALFAKAKWFGAKTVAACHVQEGVKLWDQSGWTEIYHASEVISG